MNSNSFSSIAASTQSHVTVSSIPSFDKLEQLYSDKTENRHKIVEFVKQNPNTEHYYTFKVPDNYGPSTKQVEQSMAMFAENSRDNKICIAGSSALWRLYRILAKRPNWKPTDTDIFLLDSSKNSRFNVFGYSIDIVHTTDKDPIELISNFDLPCCRVAYDFNYTYYVSIQALAAIFSRKMYLPKYFETKYMFETILDKSSTVKKDYVDNQWIKSWYNRLYNRLSDRIKKYQSRGFAPKYYNTTYILPWITQRFAYSDFDSQNQPAIKNTNDILFENDLRSNLKHLTNRTDKDVENICNTLKNEWDIITKEDLFLLGEPDIRDLLDSLKSIPMKRALTIIWKNGHDQLIENLMNSKDAEESISITKVV